MTKDSSGPTAIAYLTDTGPSSGLRRRARSWLHSDAPALSLDGNWRFRLLAGAPGTFGGRGVLPPGESVEGVAAVDFDDSAWDTLAVPCHWVLQGAGRYGSPIYTNVQMPFPQDPPNPPDENPTGDHRRTFTLPAGWVDPNRNEAVVLRFDGVESRYRVWVNGELIGVGVGSRLAQEFDVTAAVHEGENLIVVRVHQWSASTYVEDQDQWWLPGIFRSVSLQARPIGGLEDVWLRVSFDRQTGAGIVDPEIRASGRSFPVQFRIAELGVDVTWQSPADVGPIAVGGVEPWSAEQPRLYDATVTSGGAAETISMRLGFRTVEIVGDRFLVNGRRVVLHGMNRHETHPDRGRVFDEEFARRDLEMMKRFNVNAIRTSHYPPHPRLLDLADELGLWVMLENDIETHGFHHGGDRDEWLGNPSEDPAWRDAYLDRMERVVERDKNHPSIVMWSLGNESGTGSNLAAIAAWTRARDAGRPIHYEGDRAGDYTDVYSRMYPSIAETQSIGDDSTSLLDGSSGAESARQRSKPFILCEYVHAMGNGPGGIDLYENLVDRYPRLHGGFVWEWRDHGIRTHTPDGTEFFGYGGDFGEVVHDGPFCMDGMVLSDDTPTPGLFEFAAVVAPIRFSFGRSADGTRTLTVSNLRHSADTSDLTFRWRAEQDGARTESGELAVNLNGRSLEAGAAGVVTLPAVTAATTGETWLTVEAVLASDAPWAAAGHIIAAAQLDLTPPTAEARAGRPPVPLSTAAVHGDPSGVVDLGPATFVDGRLVGLAGLPVSGPQLELWRAPTDNDGGSHLGSYDLGDPMAGRGLSVEAPSYASTWRRAGLDRLVRRVVEVSLLESQMRIRTRYGAADTRPAVSLEETWSFEGNDLWLRLDIEPTSRWDLIWPRIGVRFDLPRSVDEASWFGTGPGDSYPDSRRAVRVGRFSGSTDDLTVRYARPQESGHRSDLRSLTLSTGGAPWLTVDAVPDGRGRRPGFTLARHTAQEVDRARHPHELPEPTASYLYLDAAQNGLGSRACGPDVWPDALLRPEARSLVLKFTA
ncbi:glycoside hydrolase family 2 TIM barrel-domain containing protein [Pengzhenrongella frigida]|uniref:Beta-galactosidase n=1 Tax=Pengzhenrongella frigida TaxID=1259133 RepID=A0A4Q5MXV2_9MICO|nr:glycoside hydrolase family 2 TIM barrel-domain containing protein [Cellulomonas sp. HLT2-17]RYV50460.1 DUF4981 domain-containing protein [Cellulomonas sp. HLT2-17]